MKYGHLKIFQMRAPRKSKIDLFVHAESNEMRYADLL